jgi:hypothetical protein
MDKSIFWADLIFGLLIFLVICLVTYFKINITFSIKFIVIVVSSITLVSWIDATA